MERDFVREITHWYLSHPVGKEDVLTNAEFISALLEEDQDLLVGWAALVFQHNVIDPAEAAETYTQKQMKDETAKAA